MSFAIYAFTIVIKSCLPPVDIIVSNPIWTYKRRNTRGVNPVFTRLRLHVALNPHRMTHFLWRPNKSSQLYY